MRKSMRVAGLATVGALAACSVGILIGVYVVAPPVPASLESAAPITSVPVGVRTVDDSRNIPLAIVEPSSTGIASSVSGRVTAIRVSPGAQLSSGEAAVDVDDTRMVALATATPLWRPLADGATGADVTALQNELARLGYDITTTGTMNWATRWAAADLIGIDDGHGGVPLEIPTGLFLWIPAATVTVTDVPLHVGDTIDGTQTLFTAGADHAIARLTLPEEAIGGARRITVSTGVFDVPEDGILTDAQTIARIKESTQYQEYLATTSGGGGDSGRLLTVPWALADPIDVRVIPPAALFGVDGSTACIADEGQVHAVQIVASQLGQTMVISEDDFTQVDLVVEGLSCP
ncbi:peptidoglycan-binding domain-containing protein [Actinomyces mediterranea]|uniref:peptidoglycan-binding domain-containing protein n=1 Tax=Actinomyces mediterranea TaxID=1871028 RepID=UPI00097083E4|nr:hypothetical protein [Actinomyces mediterranea]